MAESGVFVQIGYIDEANGTFEKNNPEQTHIEQTTTPETETSPPDIESKELLTQDTEESISLEEQKRKEEAKRKRIEEEKRKREEEQRLLAEQREKENRVNNAMQAAFGNGSDTQEKKGDAPRGTGVQGSTTGNASASTTQGIGGWGGFSLNGRRCLDLPKPSYESNVEGTVIVDITVSREGNVIAASVKAGSSTNASLRKAALDAARKARFNTSTENVNQMGTITYYFKQR